MHSLTIGLLSVVSFLIPVPSSLAQLTKEVPPPACLVFLRFPIHEPQRSKLIWTMFRMPVWSATVIVPFAQIQAIQQLIIVPSLRVILKIKLVCS